MKSVMVIILTMAGVSAMAFTPSGGTGFYPYEAAGSSLDSAKAGVARKFNCGSTSDTVIISGQSYSWTSGGNVMFDYNGASCVPKPMSAGAPKMVPK